MHSAFSFKFKCTAALLLVALSLVLNVAALEISNWYAFNTVVSEGGTISYAGYSTEVALWTEEPRVWYDKLDERAVFPFLTVLNNGAQAWTTALKTTNTDPTCLQYSISISSTYQNAPIEYYGGTVDQLNDLDLFECVPENAKGFTECNALGMQQFWDEFSYNTAGGNYWIQCYEQQSVKGYIVSNDYSYAQYNKTGIHELGHAMGWRGHAQNSSWIMYQGDTTVSSIQTNEREHLRQFYREYHEVEGSS